MSAKRKSKPVRGRPSGGRVAVIVYLLPAARDALDARKRDKTDTRGKIIERLLGLPDHQNKKGVS